MIRNREDAARAAEESTTNTPGMCQQWTRTMFGAPSVGDVDGDGDADAVDGWKSEKLRHPGDRNPPRGVPVAWSGGAKGFGHRAVSLGGGKIRSTDAGGRGRVATVDLGWVEANWGMTYLGWSEDISGIPIPLPPAPPKPKRTRVEKARALMEHHLPFFVEAAELLEATPEPRRGAHIQARVVRAAVKTLRGVLRALPER